MRLTHKTPSQTALKGFPVVIAVVGGGPNLNDQVLAALQSTFRKIRERSTSGVLVAVVDDSSAAQIAQAAEQAGLSFRLLEAIDSVKAANHENGRVATEYIELAETSD